LVSLSGAGPTMFANVELLLSQPIHNFATVPTDNNGGAYYPVIVPLNLTGSSVWFQAVVVGQGEAWTSNGLAETVL